MFVAHMCVFFGEMFIQLLCSFFTWVFGFPVVELLFLDPKRGLHPSWSGCKPHFPPLCTSHASLWQLISMRFPNGRAILLIFSRVVPDRVQTTGATPSSAGRKHDLEGTVLGRPLSPGPDVHYSPKHGILWLLDHQPTLCAGLITWVCDFYYHRSLLLE